MYKKHNVDVILRMSLQNSENSIERKVEDVNKIYGGYQGYKNLVEQVNKFNSQNDQLAKSLK